MSRPVPSVEIQNLSRLRSLENERLTSPSSLSVLPRAPDRVDRGTSADGRHSRSAIVTTDAARAHRGGPFTPPTLPDPCASCMQDLARARQLAASASNFAWVRLTARRSPRRNGAGLCAQFLSRAHRLPRVAGIWRCRRPAHHFAF